MRRRATRRPDAIPPHSPGPPGLAASPGGARSCGHRLVFGLYRAGYLAGAAPRMEARVDRARRSTRARCSCTPALPPCAVTGRYSWLAEKTVLTQALTELGSGFWVMTPLQLDDGAQVLVNRGFVPQEQRAQWLAKPMPASIPPTSTTATVQGLVRMSEPD